MNDKTTNKNHLNNDHNTDRFIPITEKEIKFHCPKNDQYKIQNPNNYNNKIDHYGQSRIPALSSNQILFPPKQQQQISIAWRNLRVEVRSGRMKWSKKKAILQRLNGSFTYHSLNALMGPSGSGKTTLLNCLSGNCDSYYLTTESEIYLNVCEKKNPISYIISQHVHENIMARMSVLDILTYAYKFKNNYHLNKMEREQHIHTVLTELMLPLDILDRTFHQCSSGQQKRVAIAQELMALQQPTFLFLDEPTTGLDSVSAFEVVRCLRHLSTNYRITILASIHAPNHETLCLFDHLYVLSKGGVCIYSGKPNLIGPLLERDTSVKLSPVQPPIEALIHIACGNGMYINVYKWLWPRKVVTRSLFVCLSILLY